MLSVMMSTLNVFAMELCVSLIAEDALLSNYFTGRDSNRGACAQPCRWKYALYSKNDQNPIDEYYPVEEDEHGHIHT